MGKFSRQLKAIFCCGRADSLSDPLSSRPGSPITAQSTPPTSTFEKVPPKEPAEQLTPFQQQARQIAQIPVAGMRRTTGLPGGYVTTYQTTQTYGIVGRPTTTAETPASSNHHSQNPQQPKVMPSHSTIASTDSTVVGGEDYYSPRDEKKQLTPGTHNSTWQGKPNGTTYDRREELTEEDEDMWARMAM